MMTLLTTRRRALLPILLLGALVPFSAGCGEQELSPEEAADRQAVSERNSRFAFDLYARLRQGEGNLFASPASISTALAMTEAGAWNRTAEQMRRVLHFPFEGERLHAAFGSLVRDLDGKHPGHQLRLANALWGQKDSAFLPDFLTLTKDHYEAGLREVDFADATEQARQTINGWVEEKTEHKIKELLKRGDVDNATRLVLANAIYFKGDWAAKFKTENTREETFRGASGEKNVPLMHQTGGRFNYLAADSFQALELPYAGNKASMVVFLPKKAEGLAEFEKSLTAANVTAWLAKMHETEVDEVVLPKFQMRCKFQLVSALTEMGMGDAFNADLADFSGMAGRKGLYIDKVIHQAFVNVNEEGTEATAATAVVMKSVSARLPLVFRADHPFVFLIRDNRFGSILFLGRLVNP